MEWPTKGGTINVRLVRGWALMAVLPYIGGSATELSATSALGTGPAADLPMVNHAATIVPASLANIDHFPE